MPTDADRSKYGKEIPRGMIARLTDAARAFVNGYFPPGEPPKPAAPPDQQEVRILDYPTLYNTQQTPRATEGISFAMLRGLADACPLVRIVIETRKDQVSRLPWGFKLKPQPGEKRADVQKRAEKDERIRALTEFFTTPDMRLPFKMWIRELLEEVLVIDAPAIYRRRNLLGQTGALEVLDGATILPKIDRLGRSPDGFDAEGNPLTAYQQVIKGVVHANITREDLVYLPRNPRAHKFYGYSPVEQIILIVESALNRSMSQLQHFTHGNIPAGLIQAPKEWTRTQLEDFQAKWDSFFQNNTAQKSKIMWIPGGSGQPVFPDQETMKDVVFDEWLARVICYTFSVSYHGFVKAMNRAESEQAQEEALSEGFQPTLDYLKVLIDTALSRFLGLTDIEFAWEYAQHIKPLEQAQVDEIYLRTGVYSIDEVRERQGMDPIGAPRGLVTASGIIPFELSGENGNGNGKRPRGLLETGVVDTELVDEDDENDAAEKFTKARKKKLLAY